MAMSELEKYKTSVLVLLSRLSPLLQNYAMGDFSKEIEIPEEEDEFTELLVGLNLMVDDIKEIIQEKDRIITERKQAEKTLKDNEEKLRNIFENSTNLFYSHTAEHMLTYLSPQVKDILGYTVEESMVRWTEFASDNPINKKGFEQTEKAIKTGKPQPPYELELIHKSGRKVLVEVREAPVVVNGKTVSIVGALTDITERRKAEDTIKQQLDEINSYYNTAPIGLAVLDTDLRYLRINHMLAEINGIPAAEHIGKTVKEIVPLLEAQVKKVTSEIIRSGKPVKDIEFSGETTAHPGVKRIWLECWYPIKNGDHKVIGFTVIVQDITERKKAEEALLNSEREKSAILNTMSELVAYQDTNHNVIWTNKAAAQSINKNVEDLQGRKCYEIWAGREKECEICPVKKALETEEMQKEEITTPDGKTWFITGYPVKNETGKIIGAIEVTLNITEHKQAKQALEENEKRFRQIFQFSPDSIIIHDMDMNILDANNKAAEEFGYSKEELFEKTIFELHTETELKHSAQVLDAIKNKSKLMVETKFVRKDGSVFWAEATPCKYTLGSKPIIHVVIRDITERKQAEDQIKKDLKEKEILLRELYHRTKNNMQVICSLLRLQASRLEDKRTKELLKEIETKIYSMAIVHQKLISSKDLSHLNLKDYLNSLLIHLKLSYIESIKDISIHTDMKDIHVLIDTAIPLGLVLNELISNVAKHAFPENKSGEIKVKLHLTPQKEITLEVSDNGVGLPKGFDIKKDTHLGLQTIIDLIEYQLDGKISFKNQKGLNCRIVIKEDRYKPRV